jgi:hypothetical protein
MASGGSGGMLGGAAGGDLRGTYPNPRVSQVTFAGSNTVAWVPLVENGQINTDYVFPQGISAGKLLILARAQWNPASAGNRIFARFRRAGVYDSTAYYNYLWSSGGTLEVNAVQGAVIMRPAVTGDKIHTSESVAFIGTTSPMVQVHTSYYLFGSADAAAPTPPLKIWSSLRVTDAGIDAIKFEAEAGTLSSFSASVYQVR